MTHSAAPTLRALCLALVLAASAPACTEPGDSPFTFDEVDTDGTDTGAEPGDDTGDPIALSCVDFESEVLPIFDSYGCTGSFCHGGDPGSGGLNVLTVDELLAGGTSGAAIVAGAPDSSLLITRVGNGSMPPGANALTDSELEVVRVWVAEGALPVPDPAVCGGDETGGDETGGDLPAGLTFADDVVPVFEDHGCSQSFCHGSAAGSGDLDIRTPESILEGGNNGPAVVPCDPDASFLVAKIEGTQTSGGSMPIGGDLMPVEDAELIRQWISEGALATFDAAACP